MSKGGAMQPRCHPWSQPSQGPCSQHHEERHMPCTPHRHPLHCQQPRWLHHCEVATPPDEVGGYTTEVESAVGDCRDPTHISSLVTEGPAFHTPAT
jgi:hypothetical protein